MNYSSLIIEKAVNELSKLPGVGKKTALRFALFLLNEDENEVLKLSDSIIKLKREILFCKVCNNISDTETCSICSNSNRDKEIICIVADIRDVMAIESTNQFKGLFHVLGGLISPMDGIGPQDLNINNLLERINNSNIKEIIFALSTTMEGEMTSHYLFKKLQHLNIEISSIAKGIAIGDELEYTDEITLGRSISNRLPYNFTITKS